MQRQTIQQILCQLQRSLGRTGRGTEEPAGQQNEAAAKGKKADLQSLVSKGQTWMVEKEPRAE